MAVQTGPPRRIQVRPQELQVDGLTVRYGGVVAVDGVSLRVAPGEIVGLIGPNGAGKSSLIDTLSGFVKPASGTVRLGDQDVTSLPVHQRVAAGLVRSWQSVEVFEDITVRENLEVGSEKLTLRDRIRDLFWSRGTEKLNDVSSEAATAFQLEGDLDRQPGELSFSQRRMITTARAVALQPSVVLLDEPAAGMSDVRRAELAAAFRVLADECGMGLLLVDHDMPFVMGLCHRIVVLNFGAKIAEGTPAEIRANPEVIAAYLRGDDHDEHDEGDAAAAQEDAVAARVPRPVERGEQLIRARDVAVGYHGRAVVEGIDVDLHAGEVLALLGANRAGKTTTLLTLAGALLPIRGDVMCLGNEVSSSLTPQRLADAGFGFLTDDRAVFRQLTVAENLRVGRCDVDLAVSLFPELEGLMRRRVGLLSGGEQQMVGLARALGRHPRVMLVDEMSLGLAPRIVRRLMNVLRTSADEHGVGVILVEQHVPEALRIADNVCVIAGGRMTLRGRVDDVRDRVDSAFLADVLGDDVAREHGGAA
jgi:sulfate-transporting ATPase